MIRMQRVVSIDPGPPEEELLVCVNTAVFKPSVSGVRKMTTFLLARSTQAHSHSRHPAGLEIQTFRTHIQHIFTDSDSFPCISVFPVQVLPLFRTQTIGGTNEMLCVFPRPYQVILARWFSSLDITYFRKKVWSFDWFLLCSRPTVWRTSCEIFWYLLVVYSFCNTGTFHSSV